MFTISNRTEEASGVDPRDVPQELLSRSKPIVLRGLVDGWELVRAGRRSGEEAISYIRTFDVGVQVGTFYGDIGAGGLYTYRDDLSGLNFARRHAPLGEVLEQLRGSLHAMSPPPIYVGSSTLDTCLPGLRSRNDIHFENQSLKPLVSIWLGNQSTVACHYDAPANLACCVVGHRRFTLFPPNQIHNLYPGPLDSTPGGQATTLVDLRNPDFVRYPRARIALASAEVAEMEPGDALILPSMWWHQVEGIDSFNVLINYWWSSVPGFMGTPMGAVYHAILTIRDRPEHERRAWRDLFDFYVFGGAEQSSAHIPEHARGYLGRLDDLSARQLRALLMQMLNR